MTDRRVLITGATGLLGTWLRATAPSGWDVVPLLHRRRPAGVEGPSADLLDAAQAAGVVRSVAPDLVVHTAYAQDEASVVDATRHVAAAVAATGAALLHISTDAVFSGCGRSQGENEPPEPMFPYGSWKVASEQAAATLGEQAAVARLPLIVSVDPDDPVVSRMRRHAPGDEPVPWFSDEVRQPANAADLATALWAIAALPTAERVGTWHLPGPERLTRYEIARRVVAHLGLPAGSIAPQPTPPDARRPRDLHLRDDRARAEIGWAPTPILPVTAA